MHANDAGAGQWGRWRTGVARYSVGLFLVMLVSAVSCREAKKGDPISGPPDLAPGAGCRPSLEQCVGYPPPTDPSPTSPGLYTNTYSLESCFRERPDYDFDGVWDTCENALAQTFAPLLAFSSDCSYDAVNYRVGGEYYYAVTRIQSDGEDRVRIAWIPAYYRDCGSPGDPHSGDSEFIIHEISYDNVTAHWETEKVFLSSHCGATILGVAVDGDCKWYHSSRFVEWNDGKVRGAPKVWVAANKHAHYVSRDACNNGAFHNDYCPGFNQRRYPTDYTWQNLGSGSHPFTDVTTVRWPNQPSPALTSPTAVERFWTTEMVYVGYGVYAPRRFNGWQSSVYGDGPGPYSKILNQFGFNTAPVTVAASDVWIEGQQTIQQYGNCTYQGRVNFGAPPYYYEWVQNGNAIARDDPWLVTDNGREGFWLQLTVTDGAGVQRSSAVFSVAVNSTAPQCIQ